MTPHIRSHLLLAFTVLSAYIAWLIAPPQVVFARPALGTAQRHLQVSAPTGLQFTATPAMVDVGGEVILQVSASHWPAPAGVVVSFLSAHHGFTGRLVWQGPCSCFRVAVFLARRVHSLETAHALAKITYGGVTRRAATIFAIRGLAANGKDFAPGGTPILTAWVSNPRPVSSEKQHYCIWVRTADALGVAGLPVTFVAHFDSGAKTYYAGITGKSGVVCTRRSLAAALPGFRVQVDAYVGSLHAASDFTPRS